MKRDLKINFSKLEEIVGDIKRYKSALKEMESALTNIVRILKENEGESIKEILDKYSGYKANLKECYNELDDLDILISGYIKDMQAIIRPINKYNLMRVDRNDIYMNKMSIINACNTVSYLAMNRDGVYGGLSIGMSKEEKARQEANFRKLEDLWNHVLPRYSRNLNTQIEQLNNIYNKKIVPFENKDDEYKTKANKVYHKYTNTWERICQVFKDVLDAIGDFLYGLFNGVVDLLVGLKDMVFGVVAYLAAGVVVVVTSPFNAVPEWAKNIVDSTNNIISTVLDDPMLIIEAIAQQASDTIEEKGIAYATGYIAVDVIAEIVGSKGLDKLSKLKKLETAADVADAAKVADDIADASKVAKATKVVAEAIKTITNKLLTKFDEIFDIVAETVDKGAEILFKMLDGTEVLISKAQLKAQGVLESALEFCITGCFTGEVQVLTNKGLVRIDEVCVGDLVYSTDVETGDKKFKEVLQIHRRNTNEFVILNIEGEEIRTTPTHLFYTSESTWQVAGELKPGDGLVSANGEIKKVISVKDELLEQPEGIYNLNIEGYNTYYVSSLSLLVHNLGCPKLVDLMGTVATKYGKFTVSELQNLWDILKVEKNYSRTMMRELMKGVDEGEYILEKVQDGGRAYYKIEIPESGTKVILDSNGKTIEMSYTIGSDGVRGSGYSRTEVPVGTERGHYKSVLEGAADNCIEDSPLNIVPQTRDVNCPKMSDFERYRHDNCQGMEIKQELLENGYVRVQIPDADIDITYNPLSKIATNPNPDIGWPSDWYAPSNAGRVWD